MVTKFDRIFYVPKSPWLQKAKATKNKEEEDDDKKPVAV
jgi:hypothetical protein